MEVINLNLIPSGALPVVHASQYDEGRTFRVNLMDGSTVYTLDGSEVLECDVKKPDGNIVTVAVTNTSDSYVEIDTTLQMCACAGESLAELHITKGAQEIGTLNFILAVERSPLEGGIQSDSGIHNLQTQIGEAVAEQYAAEDVVFDAAPTAGHGVGYAVTSEGVKNAIVGAVNEVNTKLSNKADKALTAFNLTAGTGMTLQYVNCFAFGNLKVISANIIVGSGATTTIATVPSAYSAFNYTFFYLGKVGGDGAYGYIAGTSLKTDSVLSTGNYTINFVYR